MVSEQPVIGLSKTQLMTNAERPYPCLILIVSPFFFILKRRFTKGHGLTTVVTVSSVAKSAPELARAK
jgi:hypothetical protein